MCTAEGDLCAFVSYPKPSFSIVPGEKFSTIQIPIMSAITATDVVPAHVAPDTDALAPSFVVEEKKLGPPNQLAVGGYEWWLPAIVLNWPCAGPLTMA